MSDEFHNFSLSFSNFCVILQRYDFIITTTSYKCEICRVIKIDKKCYE